MVAVTPASAEGISLYDVVARGLAGNFDPTLSGGDFDGMAISSLSIDGIVGVRDASSQLGLLGPSGLQAYSVVSGAAIGPARNPTLSGGDFSGQTISSLSIDDVVGYRDASSQLGVRGPSGLNAYSVVSGALAASPFNPTLTGGDFDGVLISDLPANRLAGYRDAGGSQLALFLPIPEPSSVVLMVTAVAGFVAFLRRRHR